MMYTGSYVLGDRVPLRVLCTDSNNTPVSPDTNPHVQIYDSSGNLIVGRFLPADDLDQQAGFFADTQSLNTEFSAGQYTVVYSWQISSSQRSRSEQFVIEASGDTGGRGISTHFFAQPKTDFVLIQDDTGFLSRHRNPTVDR